jgi:hypothetical protein
MYFLIKNMYRGTAWSSCLDGSHRDSDIETVMLIGDMDDEGFDNFELVRDLFASSNIMKDQHQTL